MTALQRFWSKVEMGGTDCWLWTGCVDALGYGRVNPQSSMGENRAHRFAYRLFVSEIPIGMNILHCCDVRRCVNPKHLFIGTQADNVADMISKGRHRTGDVSGEHNGMAKLTEGEVSRMRDLRANGWTHSELAREFGVTAMTVNRAVRNQSWKSVQS